MRQGGYCAARFTAAAWLAVGAVVAVIAAIAASGDAAAQTVYRCGTDGRSYSHQPCADGRALRADDARTPAQRSDAEAA